MPYSYSRRKFLGVSAMSLAAATGSSVIALSSCKKEEVIPGDIYADALVIGSGFGGAVAALRLGEKGVNTVVLEMGRAWDVKPDRNVFSPLMNPDKRACWLKTEGIMPLENLRFSWSQKYIGVLDKVDYSNMSIYRGNGVGGGSLAYGAMTVKTPGHLLSRILPDINEEELDNTYYPRVINMLQAWPAPPTIQESEYFQYNRVSKLHSERAGFPTFMIGSAIDFNILQGEIDGTVKKSLTKGDIIYGVNNGAKNSLDRNYLPAAIGTGHVQIHTQHRAKSIRILSNGLYDVVVEQINEQAEAIATKTYTCKYLFVNAGVIGTMQLLLRAREQGTLPDLNEEIGKRWGWNGNVMAMRKNIIEETGAQQANPPIMATGFLDNPIAPMLTEQAPFPIGLETHSLLSLSVTFNETFGEWQYRADTDDIDLIYPESGKAQSIDATQLYMDRLNEANSGEIDTAWLLGGLTSHFTYHPLGGAVLGKASDLFGRLKGYKNLYCLDGSMIPGNAMANPSLLIAALAERAMDDILEKDIV